MKFAHCAAVASVLLAIACGSSAVLADSDPSGKGDYLAAVPERTQEQLVEAKRATEKFKDVNVAVAEGYVRGPYESGEGFHYLNQDLLSCTFDVRHPAVLLYAHVPDYRYSLTPDDEHHLSLVALEYAIPIPCQPPDVAPAGFYGDLDVWNTNEDVPLWLVTVWVFYHNPYGVFTQLNPRVP